MKDEDVFASSLQILRTMQRTNSLNRNSKFHHHGAERCMYVIQRHVVKVNFSQLSQ